MAGFKNLIKKCTGFVENLFGDTLHKAKGHGTIKTPPSRPAFPSDEIVPFDDSHSVGAIRFANSVEDDIKDRFEALKDEFLEQVSSHGVTQELRMGPTGTSQYLAGVQGDLFSFIGFRSNANPAQDLMEFLQDRIHFNGYKTSRASGSIVFAVFSFSMPSRKDFETSGKFEVPDWGLNPWPYYVEIGLDGLAHYLGKSGRGRSEGGVQVKGEVRNAGTVSVSYIPSMILAFKRKLIKSAGAGQLFEFDERAS